MFQMLHLLPTKSAVNDRGKAQTLAKRSSAISRDVTSAFAEASTCGVISGLFTPERNHLSAQFARRISLDRTISPNTCKMAL